ncbi:hypothetical protein G6O69_07935 [Pseudenhygromyxa sp. WMMC2535]|uniref:hypothetical protein n=1 Tax=Pseudenhygromyxa sp. WMMC2535 TaxID=2712867 RepID=UPI0015556A30|nr:hypothetical protein [Pseudenhygromyxa sp. WMMC2535]NVB37759.1 hypothetical protein [Pseudenhygromyxa sp. WMMC2535]
MSVADIQDNKWEREAAQVKLTTPASIGMLTMMGLFGLFFIWIAVMSVVGAFTDPKEMDFDKKQKDPAAAEAPAE